MRHSRQVSCDKSERGAILVVSALLITALLVVVAIVIDLGATRSDRRGMQLATDNAAASAAFALSKTVPGGGAAVCEEAFSYLKATLGTTFTAAAPNDACSKVASCDATVEKSVTRSAGPYTATFYHPVLNSKLMAKTSTIGAAAIGAGNDGSPCQRVGILLEHRGTAYFGGIAGDDQRKTEVWTVARASKQTTVRRPVNLLVLDRTGCQTFTSNGGAKVHVLAVQDKDGVLQPGVAGVDSDGSACKKTGQGKYTEAAIQINGGPGEIIAFGPCEDGTTSCGTIETWASVASGTCPKTGEDRPACDEGSGTILPGAKKMVPSQLTRAPIDYRYNCKTAYPISSHPWASLQPIPACTDAPTADSDWVDELYEYAKAVIASPSSYASSPHGFKVINKDTGTGCSPTGTQVFTGNYYVDCDTFSITGGADIAFAAGNVVFRDQLSVTSGSLTLNRCTLLDSCAAESAWTVGSNFAEWSSSKKGAWTYVGGLVTNNGTLNLNSTTLFLGESSRITQAGGSNLSWVAPNDTLDAGTAGPFEDLALWSESQAPHSFAGGGATEFEGVFFAGRATIDFGGTSPMILEEAQFIGNRLNFGGATTFKMRPDPTRAVDFDQPGGSTIIR